MQFFQTFLRCYPLLMTNPYRDALQALHDAVHEQFFGNDTGLPPRLIKACNEAGQVLCRKPQPEPEGLTDDDLRGIFYRFCDSSDDGPSWIESEAFIQAARAVLAKWGHQ